MTAEEYTRMTNGGKSMQELLEDDALYDGAIHGMMENYAEFKRKLNKVDSVSTTILMNNVLPENSVLFKDGHECWHYYYDDTEFDENKEPRYSQKLHETFDGFIRRVVKSLMTQEDKEEYESLVGLDLSLI